MRGQDETNSVASVHDAIAADRHLQPTSLERRITVRLSRLWSQQGKRDETRAWLPHPSTAGSPRTLTPPNSKRPRKCSKSCHDVAPYRCSSFQNGFTGASVSLVKGSDEADGSQVFCSESPEAGPPRRRKIDVGQPAHHHPAGDDPRRGH
jgi:hypothetical protein